MSQVMPDAAGYFLNPLWAEVCWRTGCGAILERRERQFGLCRRCRLQLRDTSDA